MKKKQSIISALLLLLLLLLSAACSEDTPLNDEQYIKQVYIVGSDETTNMGIRTVDVAYQDTGKSETDISVSTGGSLNIDQAITVTVDEAGAAAIDDYNFKYLNDNDVHYRLLAASDYHIPDNQVTVKAGAVYGTMPVYITSRGLNCDSLYALTFKISAVSDPDYISVRRQDTVLILAFNFVNNYSGSYQMDGYYYKWADEAPSGDSTSVSTARLLKAVNAHTVRFYHLASTETATNLSASGITLTVNPDNSVTIQAWNGLSITSSGGTYNASSGTFTIWYNYRSGETDYQFSGTLVCNND